MKQFISDFWNGEPTMALMMIEAAVICGVSLIAHLPTEQALLVYAIVRVPIAFYNRSKVSPV